MANAVGNSYREGLLADLLTATIKFIACDVDYTFDEAHDFLDDIPAGARIATSAALTNKTATDGYFDSDPATMSAVAGGDTITQGWLFTDTGVESTSTLHAFYDTNAAGAAISIATDGTDVVATPAALGWFRV